MSELVGIGYVYDFQGRKFDPNGSTDVVSDVAAHNRALEAQELDLWAGKPERWQVYYVAEPAPIARMYGGKVTTWLGTKIGEVYWHRTTINNFGAKITAIRFRGTNGVSYYGKFGSDWSQFCRVRKFK